MKRVLACVCVMIIAAGVLIACSSSQGPVKIGVSLGVGDAERWKHEKVAMEARAQELGAEIEVRLNTTDKPKTQGEDCFEMIDSGIDVLILTPRDINNVNEILEYAKEKKVKVINYARVALGQQVDLFVGYDSGRIGQMMGQYLCEKVYKGDYIILSGDPGDYNAVLIYEGAMRYINQIRDDITIVLDEAVPGWSADAAKQMVYDAVKANGNEIDAILAPNDKIAEACAEALAELNVTAPVAITGMDTELDAVRRIAAGTQSVTIYMDLQELAATAVEEAYHMATGQEVNVNATFDNSNGAGGVESNLITGRLITRENMDKLLVDTGYFTREQVYGQE